MGDISSARPAEPYWPNQVLKNVIIFLALVAALLFLILRHRLFASPGPLGAELGAPADPSEPYSAARPEWYFLFLYQFLKYLPGRMEILGAIIIPGIVATIILLMPFIGRTKSGQRFNIALTVFLFGAIAVLTSLAYYADANNPDYQIAVKNAEREAARVKELAGSSNGVPASGSLTLLRDDPLTQGPKLFAKNCASCHRYQGGDGNGGSVKDAQTASDLAGFGTRAWLTGLLNPATIDSLNYFGGTKHRTGKMPKFVKKNVANYTPVEKEQLDKVIMAVSAEAKLKSQASVDQRDAAGILQGRTFLRDALKCTDCHQFQTKDDTADAPDLTGYASRQWLIDFVSNPAHQRFYGEENDRMPAFGAKQILTAHDLGLIADWLRGDWYQPN